jgi:single-strand DNA-binding protein
MQVKIHFTKLVQPKERGNKMFNKYQLNVKVKTAKRIGDSVKGVATNGKQDYFIQSMNENAGNDLISAVGKYVVVEGRFENLPNKADGAKQRDLFSVWSVLGTFSQLEGELKPTIIGIVQGRLGKDPELRYTQNGKRVTGFSLAVPRTFGNDGITDWISCSLWQTSDNEEFCKAIKLAQQAKKGQMLAVSIRMVTFSEAEKGVFTNYTVDDYMLGRPPRGSQAESVETNEWSDFLEGAVGGSFVDDGTFVENTEDEIPF